MLHKIRSMTAADLERVLAWRNHIKVRQYMYTQHQIGLTEHTAWFERVSLDSNYHLFIFELDGHPAGFMNIHQTSPGGVADWGFYVAPDAPKGTGKKMGGLALKYAFQEAGLHKVCGQVFSYNQPSIGFHQAFQFKKEGVLRQQHYDGKEYHDVLCFGLLADEYVKR